MEEEALLSSPALSRPQRLKVSLRAAGVSKTGQRHTLALPPAGARSSPWVVPTPPSRMKRPLCQDAAGWKEGYKTGREGFSPVGV